MVTVVFPFFLPFLLATVAAEHRVELRLVVFVQAVVPEQLHQPFHALLVHAFIVAVGLLVIVRADVAARHILV